MSDEVMERIEWLETHVCHESCNHDTRGELARIAREQHEAFLRMQESYSQQVDSGKEEFAALRERAVKAEATLRHVGDTSSRLVTCEAENARLREALDGAHKTNTELFDQAASALRFEQALESIAANMCCDKCQEAALVARAALRGGKE